MPSDLNLNKIPAFGYESKHIHGSFEVVTLSKPKEKPAKFPTYRQRNFNKFVGYIPIIGTLVGIQRLVALSEEVQEIDKQKQNAAYYKREFKISTTLTRGMIEMLSLGIIFLPLDIAVTGSRKIKQLYFNNH